MAKGKGAIQGWITKNGVHIPIYGSYTVRGGEEPKGGKAKLKGFKKKKDLSAKQVRQATTYLSTSNKDSIKAVKEELNKMDDSKEVFSGVTVKDLKEHFSGVDENTTLGEYRKQLFDKGDQDTPIKSETSDRPTKVKRDMKTGKVIDKEYQNKDGKKRWESDKRVEVDSGQEKDKYANRDWNKDVDDAKRYGYSEQTEEGKKPVTKAEATEYQKSGQLGKDLQASNKALDEKWQEHSKQESPKVTPESYAQSRGKSIRDIAQEVNNNDAARATANQLMKDGRTYEEAAALAHSDMERGTLKGQGSSIPNTLANRNALKQQIDNYTKNHPNPTSEDRARVSEMRSQYAKMMQEEKNRLAANKAAGTTVKPAAKPTVNQQSSTDSPSLDRFEVDRAVAYKLGTNLGDEGAEARVKNTVAKMSYKEMSQAVQDYRSGQASSTSKSYPWTKSTAEPAASSLSKSGYTPREKKQVLSDDAKAGISGPRRAVQFSEMTVSGLKSALANASSAQGAKIRAELRKRGYSLVGGKWVKGRKE